MPLAAVRVLEEPLETTTFTKRLLPLHGGGTWMLNVRLSDRMSQSI